MSDFLQEVKLRETVGKTMGVEESLCLCLITNFAINCLEGKSSSANSPRTRTTVKGKRSVSLAHYSEFTLFLRMSYNWILCESVAQSLWLHPKLDTKLMEQVDIRLDH